ncbi:MAG: class I SAM-dependent methyltransferase, partial [Solirubrobacteraceae bacterium]
MSESRWAEVDAYVEQLLVGADSALEAALQTSEDAGLPPIALTPAQGKLLHLLARVHRSSSILELGTLGGYSAIWLARALPADGRLITLELNAEYARVAAANIERAGLARTIKIEVGPALDGLRTLRDERAGPFD